MTGVVESPLPCVRGLSSENDAEAGDEKVTASTAATTTDFPNMDVHHPRSRGGSASLARSHGTPTGTDVGNVRRRPARAPTGRRTHRHARGACLREHLLEEHVHG